MDYESVDPLFRPPPPDAQPRTPSVRDYLAVSLYWLALSFFWGGMLTIILPDRAQALFGDKHKDAALTALTVAGAIVAAIAQILFGALSDGSRHPWGRRRPYLLWGTLLAVPCLLLFPHVHALAALVAVICALQLSINVACGPYQALMHDLIPPERHGLAATWIGIVGLIGRIGGPLLAVILLGWGASSHHTLTGAESETNLAHLMLVFAALLLVMMVVTFACARERQHVVESHSLGERIRALWNVPLRPYPDFVWLVVSRLGIMMGLYTVNFCLLYYVRETLGFKAGDSTKIVANFLIISTLTGIGGTLPAGWISDRIGRKTVLFAANIIGMVAGLCFALASNIWVAYVAAGVFGAGFGAFSAVDWALATGLLPPREPAKYMGIWGVSDTLSQVLAPLIAGPLALTINHAMGMGVGYRALMLLSLVWFGLGTLALRPIREPKHQVEAASSK